MRMSVDSSSVQAVALLVVVMTVTTGKATTLTKAVQNCRPERLAVLPKQ